ncbi:DUF3581 family protein [Marinobacter salicampi]|uniref:DUF3581 family protein n=1 Tax=Marinobacter salicampi TaxID=435907 RepID=UPI00140E5615|nr:DUF3581 family protein [Marinobacter salicampi]
MFLDRFHSIQDGRVVISADQASHFAREVAGDYNPIHNPDHRRFCVPGDLLFALVVWRFGLSQNMTFQFRNLLGGDVALNFNENPDGSIDVCDTNGKRYLEVTRSGDQTSDETVIEKFTRCYVAASGKNFPYTLKPLMESKGVMFNPDRPMVIYESMSVSLDHIDAPNPGLELNASILEVVGKRGNCTLEYGLTSDHQPIGTVIKKLVVSGLREYDAGVMDRIVTEFYRLKDGA